MLSFLFRLKLNIRKNKSAWFIVLIFKKNKIKNSFLSRNKIKKKLKRNVL